MLELSNLTNSLLSGRNGRNSAKQNKNSRNSGKRKRSDSENAAGKKNKNRRLQGTKASNFHKVKDATTWTKFLQVFKTLQNIHKVMSYKNCLIRGTESKLESIMVCYNEFEPQPTKANKL